MQDLGFGPFIIMKSNALTSNLVFAHEGIKHIMRVHYHVRRLEEAVSAGLSASVQLTRLCALGRTSVSAKDHSFVLDAEHIISNQDGALHVYSGVRGNYVSNCYYFFDESTKTARTNGGPGWSAMV
jgi:hypothetical protein